MSFQAHSAGRRANGKVLLVNYAGFFLSANTFVPDNSLATLAGTLVAHGVPVEIVDLQSPREVGHVMELTDGAAASQIVQDMRSGVQPASAVIDSYRDARNGGELRFIEEWARRLLEKIHSESVSLVGFKLWAGGGLRHALELAALIRRGAPHVTLIGGGPAVTYAKDVLQELSTSFDRLVPGDGEHAILTAALGPDAPPASSFVDLDSVPFPMYDKEIYPGIDEFFRLRMIDESRGCFNRCAFCAHPHLTASSMAARQRVRDAKRVVDQLEHEVREHGVRHFRLSGSNPPWRLVRHIADEITRRRLDVNFAVFSSFNNCDARDFPRLYEAGLRSIFFGVETADPALLRRAHGKDNGGPEHVASVTRAAMQAGIFTCLSFIVPSPFETEAHRQATLDLISRVFQDKRHGSVLALPPLLTPGTRWWAEPETYGFEFLPGVDRRSYLKRTITMDIGLCFPRQTWPEYGYRVGGLESLQAFEVCEGFVTRVREQGIVTDLDDSGFLLSSMAGCPAGTFQRDLIEALLLGGAERTTELVARLNSGGSRASKHNTHTTSRAA